MILGPTHPYFIIEGLVHDVPTLVNIQSSLIVPSTSRYKFFGLILGYWLEFGKN